MQRWRLEHQGFARIIYGRRAMRYGEPWGEGPGRSPRPGAGQAGEVEVRQPLHGGSELPQVAAWRKTPVLCHWRKC